jgi:hypothetical protein
MTTKVLPARHAVHRPAGTLAAGRPAPPDDRRGTDPSPTLAQFEHYVATGQVKYLIAGGGMAMGGGSAGVAAQITKWVEAHYKKITIGGQTVYDLSQPLS